MIFKKVTAVIQLEKVFYAKYVGLNLIPGTHVMEGKISHSRCPLSDRTQVFRFGH